MADDQKHNPKPERLIIEGMTFDEAAEKASKKERPKGGWPNEKKTDTAADDDKKGQRDE